jgi:uncharacterized repeat protein (TIGR01451 family)
MEQRVGTAVRITVLVGALLTVLLAGLTASAQIPTVIDYKLEILPSGVAYPSGEVGYAFLVSADWNTNTHEPFVVQVTIPPGLEPSSLQCFGYEGQAQFDPATRVLTWSDRLDNDFIAFDSCPLHFRIDPTVPPGSTFSLTATLTTSKPDPKPSNDIASVETVVVAAADLEVKSSADRRKLKPGETLAYTLELTNHGPQTAHDVVLTDQLSTMVSFVSFEQTSGPPAVLDAAPGPGGGDCFPRGCSGAIRAFFATLPAGSVATFRLVVVTNTAFESGDIWNRVIVHSDAQVDIADRNNVADELVLGGPDADLAITSEVSEMSGTHSTVLLRISNAGPAAVNAVTVENILSSAAWNYELADLARYVSVTPSQGTCAAPVRGGAFGHPPPPEWWSVGCQIGTLAPGAVATITVVFESTPAVGPIAHSAFVRPAQNDPHPDNNDTQVIVRVPRRRSARH